MSKIERITQYTPGISAHCCWTWESIGVNKQKVKEVSESGRAVSQSACQWDKQSDRGQACHGLITPARGFGACHSYDRTKMCQDEGNRLPLSSCVPPEPCRCAVEFPLGVSGFMDHSFDSYYIKVYSLKTDSLWEWAHIDNIHCMWGMRKKVTW